MRSFAYHYTSHALRSTFIRNVFTLISGNSLALAIPILAAPILGRLYSPSENGLLGIYMCVAAVFGGIANWQYSQAIVLDKSDNNAASLYHAGLLLSLLTSVFAMLVSIVAILSATTLGYAKVRWWFLFLPISTLFAGVCSCQSAVANRQGIYKRLAILTTIPTLISVAVSIGLGNGGWGVHGLFIAYAVGQTVTVLLSLVAVPRLRTRSETRSKRRVFAMLRKHRRFALYTMPTSFVSNFALNTPIYALTLLNYQSSIGLYQRANQLIGVPASILGSSVAQVFQRKAALERKSNGDCRAIFRSTFWTLLALGAVPTFVLGVFAPNLFEWFLGSNWRDGGRVAQILAPTLLLRVICSPLSTVFYITGKQAEDFYLTIGLGTITVALVFATVLFNASDTLVFISYSLGMSLTYTVFMVRSYCHSFSQPQSLYRKSEPSPSLAKSKTA